MIDVISARLGAAALARCTAAPGLFALLGFSCGLPYPLIGATLSLWFASMHLSLGVVAALSWILLPYSLKPLWARLIDTARLPVPGHTVAPTVTWILWSQMLLIVLLVMIGFAMSLHGVIPVVILSILAAFCGASQDCAVDALRITCERTGASLDTRLLSGYQFGYRLALFIADGIILLIINYIGWSFSYILLAGTLLIPLALFFCHSQVSNDGKLSAKSWYNSLDVVAYSRDVGYSEIIFAVPVSTLFIIVLYRLPDAVSYPVLNLNYIASGLSTTDIAFIHSAVVLPVSVIGLGVVAILLRRLGLTRSLIIGGCVQAAGCLGLGIVTINGGGVGWFAACNIVTALATSISGVALVLYIAMFVDTRKAAYQYAVLVSMYSFSGKVLGGISGFFVSYLSEKVGEDYGFGLLHIALAITGLSMLPLISCQRPDALGNDG